MLKHTQTLFLCFLGFRILNALLVQTFHVADEYWQTLEVAHRFVWGYGYLTWEWQPAATLRSFAHPGLFAALYSALRWCGLDAVWPASLEILPKLLQSAISSVGDVCLHLFAAATFGQSFAVYFSLANLTNWFLLHNLTRTLANSIETSLFAVFLCFWPVVSEPVWTTTEEEDERRMIRRRRVALVAAGACFVFRPTSAVIWLFFAAVHFFETRRKLNFILEASLISSLVLIVAAAIDAAYFGDFVSPLLQFVKFNFLSSGAAHYGSHPWHWYLSNGLPMLLGPFILPFALGLLKMRSQDKKFAALILTNVAAFSLIGHKEARFLMPLIPICNIFVAQTLSKWLNFNFSNSKNLHPLQARFPQLVQPQNSPIRRRSHASHFEHPKAGESSRSKTSPKMAASRNREMAAPKNREMAPNIEKLRDHENWAKVGRRRRMLPCILACLVITSSLVMAIYTCAVHQRGNLDLMRFVRSEEDIQSLLLLMPCHHTPGYAYVHRESLKLDFLDCSPGLPEKILDEADVFYENPMAFLKERYNVVGDLKNYNLTTFVKNPFYEKNNGLNFKTVSEPMVNRQLPTHIAMYNVLSERDDMTQWLSSNSYTLLRKFFHAHFSDGRSGTHVLLYRRNQNN